MIVKLQAGSHVTVSAAATKSGLKVAMSCWLC